MRGTGAAVLGAAMLAAVLVDQAVVEDQPWGTRCHLAWCQPRPVPTVDALEAALGQAAARARLEDGRGCQDPADWRAAVDGIPAAMVVQDQGGDLEVRRWTYPAPQGVWVLSLCTR